jgi:Fe2+ or Zn2+ uptake regulation protein
MKVIKASPMPLTAKEIHDWMEMGWMWSPRSVVMAINFLHAHGKVKRISTKKGKASRYIVS